MALVGPQGHRKNAACKGVLPEGCSVLYYEIRYETKFYNWHLLVFSVLLGEKYLNSTLLYSQMENI